MDNPIEVEPQPRIDTLVVDASTGAQRRRTEYSGTVWFGGGRPQFTSFGTVTRSQAARVESPFYLPDSLPYRADAASSAVVAVSVAVQSAPDHAHQVVQYRAALVADPRNPVVAWVQVQLLAAIHIPTAISYRVDVLVPPEVVLAGEAPPA
jgi:hypothetical protein